MTRTATIYLALALLAQCAFSQGTLIDAIKYIEDRYGVGYSYDPSMLNGIKTDGRIDTASIEDFNALVYQYFPLRIESVDSQYYAITLREADFMFKLSADAEASEFVDVYHNGHRIPSNVSGKLLSFTHKPYPGDTLTIYAPGYEYHTMMFEELMQGTRQTVGLKLTLIHLKDVMIRSYVTAGIDMNPSSQSISINVSDLPLLPGETDGDLFSSLVALPGISTPDNRAGNLFIRGSSTDQSLITVDNIPIYHRGHYFGTISPYNPRIVDNVKVYRNGFHPRSGGRVGGAVEIQTLSERSEKFGGGVGSSTLYGLANIKAAIGKKAGIALAARRSYPTSLSIPKIKALSEAVFDATAVVDDDGEINPELNVLFEDYMAKLLVQPSQKDRVNATFIFNNSKAEYPNDRFFSLETSKKTNAGLNVSWKRKVHDHLDISSNLSVSNYKFWFANGDQLGEWDPQADGDYSVNNINHYQVGHEYAYRWPSRDAAQVGLEYSYQEVVDDYKGRERRGMNQPPMLFLYQSASQSHLISPFFNYEWNRWDKFYLQAGLRANYYTAFNNLLLSPRVFSNYAFSPQVTFKGSYGLYHQYLSQIHDLEYTMGGFDNELWQLASGPDGRVVSGEQSMIGVVFEKKKWVFDVEGYHKTARNVSYSSNVRLSSQTSFFYANHEILGVDLMLKRSFGEHVNTWATYSYGSSKVILDSAREFSFRSKYDQPHVVYLGGSVILNQWKFSGGWRWSSGLVGRTMRVVREQERNSIFNEIPSRYPNVHFLDVSASYRLEENEKRDWSLIVGLSINNLYNQVNLTDEAVRNSGGDPSRLLERDAIGFAPNLLVLFEW